MWIVIGTLVSPFDKVRTHKLTATDRYSISGHNNSNNDNRFRGFMIRSIDTFFFYSFFLLLSSRYV